MSSISIRGQLLNVFLKDKRDSGDDDKYGLQLLGSIENRNGSTRHEMLDISCRDADLAEALRKHTGKSVTIPVGIFSPSDSARITFFVARGTTASDIGFPSTDNNKSAASA